MTEITTFFTIICVFIFGVLGLITLVIINPNRVVVKAKHNEGDAEKEIAFTLEKDKEENKEENKEN